MTLHTFIGNFLEPFAYLVYLLAVSVYAKKQRGLSLRVLSLYFLLAFALMLAASVLVETNIETVWLYNIHALLTVGLLGYYFRNLFKTIFKKKVITLLIVVVSLYLLVKNLVLREFRLFDSIGYSLVSASVVIYVLMYFHQLLSNVTENDIFQDFTFWLGSAFLIYFLGSFIIFLTYYYFTVQILATYTNEERYLLTNLWGLHNCLLFTGALLLLTGSLWIVYRKKSALL